MKKILIGSDIHGSYKFAEMFIAKTARYQPEKILLLGDFYYNGARNIPPEGYSPKDVVALLNEYSQKIIAVKGNCESEVDSWVSEFPIVEMAYLSYFGKEIVMAHGHHQNFDNLPKGHYDIFLQGHTHIGYLEEKDGKILANPGSVSLPKDGHHSYMVLSEESLALKDLFTDETYKEIFLK